MLLLYILFLEIKKTSFIIISSNKPVYIFFCFVFEYIISLFIFSF